MDQQHPITPPPELLQQWALDYWGRPGVPIEAGEKYIATQAAHWGADQQLEECEKYWMTHGVSPEGVVRMREHLRPKPSSLAEPALILLDDASTRLDAVHWNTIRAALKRLQELENNG